MPALELNVQNVLFHYYPSRSLTRLFWFELLFCTDPNFHYVFNWRLCRSSLFCSPLWFYANNNKKVSIDVFTKLLDDQKIHLGYIESENGLGWKRP